MDGMKNQKSDPSASVHGPNVQDFMSAQVQNSIVLPVSLAASWSQTRNEGRNREDECKFTHLLVVCPILNASQTLRLA